MRVGRDYIGVGVGAIVFNGEGKVFLAKRGPKATNEQGLWEFPGGRVEFNEKLTQAIQREFREEYDMTIEVIEMLSVNDHILPAEKQHWVSATFLAWHVAGIPKILEPEKCIAIGWFTLDALPEPLTVVSQENWCSYRDKYGLNSIWPQSALHSGNC
jgi:mutator protein MutT